MEHFGQLSQWLIKQWTYLWSSTFSIVAEYQRIVTFKKTCHENLPGMDSIKCNTNMKQIMGYLMVSTQLEILVKMGILPELGWEGSIFETITSWNIHMFSIHVTFPGRDVSVYFFSGGCWFLLSIRMYQRVVSRWEVLKNQRYDNDMKEEGETSSLEAPTLPLHRTGRIDLIQMQEQRSRVS